MTFIKNIQGIGNKTKDYLDNSLPNVAVFDGSTRYNVGTGVLGDYDPPDNNIARTYLTLHKKTSGISGYICSTRKDVTIGEYINDSSTNNIFLRIGAGGGGANSLAVGSILKSNSNKWHASNTDYDGSLFIDNSMPVVNGLKSQNIIQNFELTNNINSEHLAYLGWDKGQDYYLTGEIAIFSIYKGLFTPQQKTEYSTDPFGFIERLRANPIEQAKLHLDIDFNRAAPQLPIDLSPNAFPITLGAGTATFVPFS